MCFYYLRNGLFCISPVNTDANHALMVAGSTHEEGKTRDDAQPIQINVMEMRVCVVRVPEDVKELAQLSNFVRRFAHLVPDSGVTSFAELSRKDDFALNMALSDCIEHAIQKSTFEVYYQPIYRLSTGRFESAEALVRLHDLRYGYISPDLFIPEAEQSGAILAIGSILLKKICAFLESVDFESTGLRYVEVNLSTEQCVRSNMADELLALMQEYRVSPERINLEITETSAAYSQNIVDQNVRALARQGVTFSLDDYGTGYSNVTRMLSLPFEIVKFDKSFVNTLDDEDARTVFAASIAMMKQIGKEILVEGVETQEQADALCAMGADYIQGYLYARPLPEDEFLAFLRKHNA